MRAPYLALAVLLAACIATSAARSQALPAPSPATTEIVRAIAPPTHPLPAEADSNGITKFSFIAYGDTRSREDGVALQREHSRVVDSMVATIKRLETTDFPVRFVLQSGDAVVDGRDARQWNRSFVELIDRITAGAGLPYFLAPGNHDVTSAADLGAPGRQEGLANYLDAVAELIPPLGAPRRMAGYPAYAFGYGNTFVLAFDSTIAADDGQFNWVRAQLDGLDRKRYTHVIALFHHPVFSSGPHGGPHVEAPVVALRARYEPLFREHHVRMTLTGHEHFFEHWVERSQDATGAPYRTDHVVTGGGGAPIYTYEGEPDLKDFLAAGATGKVRLEHLVTPGKRASDNPHHYVVVRVDGDELALEVIAADPDRDYRPYTSNSVTIAPDGHGLAARDAN
jgi:3',5'-cyclic AMP phosphodiesterase CpdA